MIDAERILIEVVLSRLTWFALGAVLGWLLL